MNVSETQRGTLQFFMQTITGFSKQVKQKVTTNSLQVQSLEEEITYTFTVRAQTFDFGPHISNNVTTGPQEGSPGSPKELTVVKQLSNVELHWLNGPTGKGPILGYYLESQRKGTLCNNAS